MLSECLTSDVAWSPRCRAASGSRSVLQRFAQGLELQLAWAQSRAPSCLLCVVVSSSLCLPSACPQLLTLPSVRRRRGGLGQRKGRYLRS